MLREENKRDAEGRLRPVYRVQRPRWVGLYTNREYKGRLNWWSELGHTDELTSNNKLVLHRQGVTEKDPLWFDGPLKDGTSVAGPFGMDSKFTRNYALKGDEPMNLYDYKRKLIESSTQYKAIADKYDLSPEHPGIDVNPLLTGLDYLKWMNVGSFGFLAPGQIQHQFGPRFFDKPMNEGCVEKGLALVKYVAVANIGVTFVQFQSEKSKAQKQVIIRDLFKRWARLMPYPSALAFGYGMTICASAAVRDVDDIYNPHVAALSTAIISMAIKRNIPVAASLGLGLLFIGSLWHYQRCTRYGLQANHVPQFGGDQRFGGPHWWKSTDFSHMKPKSEVF